MQVLITEDEILLAKRLQKLLNTVSPDAVVAGITHGIKDTVEWLQTHAMPVILPFARSSLAKPGLCQV